MLYEVITDTNTAAILLSGLFNKVPRLRPERPIPVVKTDIKALDPNEDLLIWLGHSSFYVQLAGKRLLIDPVFSRDAAPVPYVNAAFDSRYQYHRITSYNVCYTKLLR